MQCDFWLDVAKALIGTFVGAGLAFGANLYVQYLQRRAADLVSGNVAMAILSQQLGDFRTVRRAVLEEQTDRASLPEWGRFRILPALFDRELKFDLEKLGFLVRKGAPLLGELALAQRLYLDLANVIGLHNSNAKEMQRKLSAAAAAAFRPLSDREALDAAGRDLVSQETGVVEVLLEHMENDEARYLDIARQFHDKLRDIFGYTFWFRKVSIIQIKANDPLEAEEPDLQHQAGPSPHGR
ncbi:MAG TPA: hypothetical protein VGR65_03860 [Casimicrobiaceae bacterium]|jgi:hypothetical protein|nr:hypothetical protein [Casimicrobiaceae bacterium]